MREFCHNRKISSSITITSSSIIFIVIIMEKQLRGQNFVCRAGPPGPGLWCVMVSAATIPTVLRVRVLSAVHTQPGIGRQSRFIPSRPGPGPGGPPEGL